MVKQSKKQGFSLTEVLVATIVMTMILTGVLGFVEYGGRIWHRGQDKINAQNYNDMTFQLLKDDLLQATNIQRNSSKPFNIGSFSKTLCYKINDNDKYLLQASNSILIKKSLDSSQKVMRLARNVNNFYVYRISTWTFEVSLQIHSGQTEDEEGNIIEKPEIVSSESVVLLAPGVEN